MQAGAGPAGTDNATCGPVTRPQAAAHAPETWYACRMLSSCRPLRHRQPGRSRHSSSWAGRCRTCRPSWTPPRTLQACKLLWTTCISCSVPSRQQPPQVLALMPQTSQTTAGQERHRTHAGHGGRCCQLLSTTGAAATMDAPAVAVHICAINRLVSSAVQSMAGRLTLSDMCLQGGMQPAFLAA